MTISHWRRTSSGPPLSCDTLVVGAGVAGLSGALALRARGVGTIVVDRGAVGCGASTRNAGYLMRGAADNYAAAVRAWGRPVARGLWTMTEQNLAMLRARGVERISTYRARPSCLLALTGEELGELRTAGAMLGEDGFDAPWIEGGEDAAWSSGLALGGLVNPGDAVCNPCELIAMLRSQLDCPVVEHQEAIAVEEDDAGVRTQLTDGVVHSARVLCCLNAYAPLLLPETADWVSPRRGQMLAIHAPGVRLEMSYYANHGSEYFRAADGGVIVVGGWRKHFVDEEVGYEDRVTEGVQGGLESFARAVIGCDGPVISRWSGTMGFSPDGRPIVAPVRAGSRVWFCGGFTGHGMSLAHITASVAADAMLGISDLPPGVAGAPGEASGPAAPRPWAGMKP